MVGVAIFGAASLGAVFSTAPWQLIAARGVMGFGAALFFPPALSILAVILAPGEAAGRSPCGRRCRWPLRSVSLHTGVGGEPECGTIACLHNVHYGRF